MTYALDKVNVPVQTFDGGLVVLSSRASRDGLPNTAVLRRAGRSSNSIVAQFNDLTSVMAWISTQAFSNELRGDITRHPVTSQDFYLLVAGGSSVGAQCNDMRMVDVWQRGAVVHFAGRSYNLNQGAVNDLAVVDAC